MSADFFRAGAWRLVGGGDASISHTEYNSSQRDFSLVSAALFAGADLEIAGVRVGARYGGGAYATTTADESGVIRSRARRDRAPSPRRRDADLATQLALTRMDAAPSRDISVTFVTTGEGAAESNWEFSAATGTTTPGAGAGGDRKLRSAAFNRTAASRAIGNHDLLLEVSWTSTAHESSLPSTSAATTATFAARPSKGTASRSRAHSR